MKNKKKNIIKALLIILVFVTAGVIYSCSVSKPAVKGTDDKISNESQEETGSEKEGEAKKTDEAKQLCVFVCGSVKQPGVYYLKSGSRVHEAVDMAGGLAENASFNSVNMAEEISDGQQIYIPSLDEEAAIAVAAQDDGLVNINTADVEQLKQLPGIGDVKAQAIVAYRESTGAFQGPEDIMNVSGIKQSAYDKIKDKIKV